MLEGIFGKKKAAELDAIERSLGEMEILDTSGHTKTTWDPEKPEEVAAAKLQFETLTGNGRYKAFRVKRDGSEGEPMKKFDPDSAAMILLIPAITPG